jgi:hypothetical protein
MISNGAVFVGRSQASGGKLCSDEPHFRFGVMNGSDWAFVTRPLLPR